MSFFFDHLCNFIFVFKSYVILPIKNITKEKVASIQARYTSNYQQANMFEHQLLAILNKKNRKTKAKRLNNYFVDCELDGLNGNFIEDHRKDIVHFEKYIAKNRLNLFTLSYKSKRLNKFVSGCFLFLFENWTCISSGRRELQCCLNRSSFDNFILF